MMRSPSFARVCAAEFALFAALIVEHLMGLPSLTTLSFGGWA